MFFENVSMVSIFTQFQKLQVYYSGLFLVQKSDLILKYSVADGRLYQCLVSLFSI